MRWIHAHALRFALAMLPVGLLGGALVGLTTFTDEIAAQAHLSKSAYVLVTALQTGVLYTGLLGYIGYVLAGKLNLLRRISWNTSTILPAVFTGVIGMLFFLFDYAFFGPKIPQVADSYTKAHYSLLQVVAGVVYGGIVEEIMLRLFMLSLLAFVLWKLTRGRRDAASSAPWIYVCANIGAALLFAAGHLPASYALFGELSALIVIRCFLMNGVLGLLFGWLYIKKGLPAAMLAHALTHAITAVVLVSLVL
ncbi:CPBP family intramembrane glutamic endopeptidase [Paenibacillus ferrarius]|uniref:CPBP family intramembrane glutamic endopeptidase n=1 Tax=Paenibacillus ferrarius TaxID=1469647 RepID=UPI003D27A0A0